MKKNFLLAASFLFIFCLEAGAQKRDEVTWEKFEDITIPITAPGRLSSVNEFEEIVVRATPDSMYVPPIYRI